MSKEFWQHAIQVVKNWGTRSAATQIVNPTPTQTPQRPTGTQTISVDPAESPTPATPGEATSLPSSATKAGKVADTAEAKEVSDICQTCLDKWLVITVVRHTKHDFSGRWDCTVGDLKMEIWESETSGSGELVFQCKTSERGGPANTNFDYSANSSQGSNYKYYNQFMIMPSESYGLAAHSTSNYRTYGYSTSYLDKPRPGIAIYGKSSGSMDRRSGVLIHAGTNHRWSVGCVVLHENGRVKDGRYRFDKNSSVNTLLKFLEKIHEFTGKPKHGVGAKIQNVKLIIRENFK